MKHIFLLILFVFVGLHTKAVTHTGIDVVLLGDSNTWLGGDSCTCEKGWSKWFVDTFRPESCVSYARSGATWTNTKATEYDISEYSEVITDNNVIYNQINRLVHDIRHNGKPLPHLIIIMAGTNDAWFTNRRPGLWQSPAFNLSAHTVDSIQASACTSLASSVDMACLMLKRIAPASRIVLVTPIQSSRIDSAKISRVADCIDSCGRHHGAMVVRLDMEGCVKASVESGCHTFTSDGVHTNIKGAQCIGFFLSRRIANGIF